MALTDANDTPARRPFLRMPARIKALLTGEHAAAQRMAGTAFIIRVASAAIIFFSQVLFARWMGSTEFGIYVYVWTWLLVASELVHLGLPLTAQRFIPEYTQRKSFDLLRGFLVGSRWLAFSMATTIAILGVCAVRLMEPYLDRATVVPFYFACAALPFYVVSMMCDGLARAYNWIGLALVPFAILRPIALIALLAVVSAAGVALDAVVTMIAVAVTMGAATLLQLIILNRRLRGAVEPGARTYDVRGWLVTSLPVIAMWSFYTLLTYTDVLVLRLFRPPDEVAHYYAASKTLALVSFVYFAVAASVAHRFTAYHVEGNREGLSAFAATSVRWIFWPSLAATLLILALGKPMLWLFGPAFVDAYPVMFVLAIGFIARSAVGPAERLLNMVGEQRRCALAYSIAFAVNLTGCFALAGPFGAMGVAAATAVAFVVESSLLFLIAKRRLGLHMLIWPQAKSR